MILDRKEKKEAGIICSKVKIPRKENYSGTITSKIEVIDVRH